MKEWLFANKEVIITIAATFLAYGGTFIYSQVRQMTIKKLLGDVKDENVELSAKKSVIMKDLKALKKATDTLQSEFDKQALTVEAAKELTLKIEEMDADIKELNELLKSTKETVRQFKNRQEL